MIGAGAGGRHDGTESAPVDGTRVRHGRRRGNQRCDAGERADAIQGQVHLTTRQIPVGHPDFPANRCKADANLAPGPFFVEGNGCIEGGSLGRVANDCRAGRYFPTRGMGTLHADGTGDAVIFLDQTIGLNPDR
jgi:hypothetical protein